MVSEKIFHVSPVINLWQIFTTPGRSQFGPYGTLLAEICKQNKKTLLYTKYKSSGGFVVSRKIYFSYCKSIEASQIDCQISYNYLTTKLMV